MSRPKSMPDFSALLDPSSTLPWKEKPRKKPSISLAAGLIMAADSPKSGNRMSSPGHRVLSPLGGQQRQSSQDEWCENLFYAYAQKSDYAQRPPYILTFANAQVCDQWWSLVQKEYPESTRMGPQLFVLKGDDMQEQIQDNPKFHDLRNKWFYTPGDGVIPLQDYKGYPVNNAPVPAPTTVSPKEEKQNPLDIAALSSALDRINAMIADNSAHIHALSVAQGEGLQRMQDINESNSTQIKALADSQSKLQAIVDQNASHYIALSNSSFSNAEQIKSVLQSTASQTKALAEGQFQLSKTCEGMMRTIENLGHTVGRVSESVSHFHSAASDTGSVHSMSSGPPIGGAMANRISPPPRKLNRRIKGVWYEYDSEPTPMQSRRQSQSSMPVQSPPRQSPRKLVNFCDTPPKSPVSRK